MKNSPNNIIALSFLGLLLCSCWNQNDDPKPPDQLPPYSQIGANTMGCLINGRVFIPREHDLKGKYFGCHDDDLTMYIDRKGERVYIGIWDKTVTDTGAYDLTYKGTQREVYYLPPPYAPGFQTNPLHTGKLHIRYWDKQHHIMAGTFYFDAIGDDSSIVHITDGRFDMIYN
ncbi:MAG: hypothetical protein K1X81_02115 [Bacteroidia bacterium]|nr:hypothetical protein [Bacteroidia bacterium]